MATGSYERDRQTKNTYDTFGTIVEVTDGDGNARKQLEVPVWFLCPRLVEQMRAAGCLRKGDAKVRMFLNKIEGSRKVNAAGTSRQDGGAPSEAPAAQAAPAGREAFPGESEDEAIPF